MQPNPEFSGKSAVDINIHAITNKLSLFKPIAEFDFVETLTKTINNKGNAKRGISPQLKIWPLTLKINRVPDSLKD